MPYRGAYKISDVEKTQWYFQRYVTHLPSAGEIVIFDRSWYNRAGVEPVMGFCTQAEHKEFLREVPKFEEMIINSGIIFFKIYLSITKEDKKRFKERLNDPLKQFKISPVDQKRKSFGISTPSPNTRCYLPLTTASRRG